MSDGCGKLSCRQCVKGATVDNSNKVRNLIKSIKPEWTMDDEIKVVEKRENKIMLILIALLLGSILKFLLVVPMSDVRDALKFLLDS